MCDHLFFTGFWPGTRLRIGGKRGKKSASEASGETTSSLADIFPIWPRFLPFCPFSPLRSLVPGYGLLATTLKRQGQGDGLVPSRPEALVTPLSGSFAVQRLVIQPNIIIRGIGLSVTLKSRSKPGGSLGKRKSEAGENPWLPSSFFLPSFFPAPSIYPGGQEVLRNIT